MVDLSEGACPSHSLQKDPPTIVPTLHMPIIGAIKNRLHCPPPPFNPIPTQSWIVRSNILQSCKTNILQSNTELCLIFSGTCPVFVPRLPSLSELCRGPVWI